jgi:hypothetical protein
MVLAKCWQIIGRFLAMPWLADAVIMRARHLEPGRLAEILLLSSAACRENYKDPESAPFGVGRGPLVRDAKKMGQPGRLVRFGNEATSIMKQGNTVGKQKAVSHIEICWPCDMTSDPVK